MKGLTKNRNKKNKFLLGFLNTYVKILMLVLLFFFLFSLIFGVRTFWLGFHSLDTGQNMRYLDSRLREYNITVVESPTENLDMSAEEVFRLGVSQLQIAFWIIIFSSLMLGMCISYFFLEVITKK